ncbi:Serine/threonine-protein kinase PrkC [Planctomycetaceae bacterium]|nr:Serine/threonine-protein kinase PrkC [Planctomycetaceae bacterium]
MRFVAASEEFVLGGKIGDGAVGLVRKATRVFDSLPVAVKFLAPDPKYIQEEIFGDVAARFRREGLRGAELQHQNLLEILAYEDNADGVKFSKKAGAPTNPFIVMEYVQGKTLESYVRTLPGEDGKSFSVTKEKLQIAVAAAEAIQFLHKMRIVHRDVKPANIFLSNEFMGSPRVKLGDFGITKWNDFHSSISSGTLTMTHQRGLGTLKYMAPEQAVSPKDVTAKADVFSFGITLFELFTGQILAGPHNVYETLLHRMSRGTTVSRFNQMGINFSIADDALGALILDMHSRGPSGRPSMEKVKGTLTFMLSQKSDES